MNAPSLGLTTSWDGTEGKVAVRVEDGEVWIDNCHGHTLLSFTDFDTVAETVATYRRARAVAESGEAA